MIPPEGFSPVQGLPFQIGAGRPLLSGSAADVKLFGIPTAGKVWGLVEFQEEFVGPPGYAHGGAQAYILDEAMGTVCWNSDIPVVAKSIQFEFFKPIPLRTKIIVTAEIKKKENRELEVSSALVGTDQTVLAAGSGLFHIISYKQFSHVLKECRVDLRRWFPDIS